LWLLPLAALAIASEESDNLGAQDLSYEGVDISAADEVIPSPLAGRQPVAAKVGTASGALPGYQLFKNKDAGPVNGGLKVRCGGDSSQGYRQNVKGTDLALCRRLCNDCFECSGFVNRYEQNQCEFLKKLNAKPSTLPNGTVVSDGAVDTYVACQGGLISNADSSKCVRCKPGTVSTKGEKCKVPLSLSCLSPSLPPSLPLTCMPPSISHVCLPLSPSLSLPLSPSCASLSLPRCASLELSLLPSSLSPFLPPSPRYLP